MSLSSRLNSFEGRSLMRRCVRNPLLRPLPPVLVPSAAPVPSWIGTAFDYGFRAGFAHRFRADSFNVRARFPATAIALMAPKAAIADRAKGFLADGLAQIELVKATGRFSKSSARGFLRLAALDTVYRAGLDVQLRQDASEEQIHELQRLLERVPWAAFQPARRALLNPTFGAGSTLAGGADADLVIDHTVVELKTSKQPGLLADTIRQLVGYAMLINAYGAPDPTQPGVSRVAYYNSRTATLVQHHLDECIDPEDYVDVLSFLTDQEFEMDMAEALRGRVLDSEERFAKARHRLGELSTRSFHPRVPLQTLNAMRAD